MPTMRCVLPEMGWPKHKWGWIVVGGFNEPLRDNGQGMFTAAGRNGYAEVFLDRKVAEHIAREEKKGMLRQASYGRASGRDERYWLRNAARVRIIRIALPGTYAQAQIPESLERQLRKSLREFSPGRKRFTGV
jgi:hypothetical protein